jgi:high-affinity iron transporter
MIAEIITIILFSFITSLREILEAALVIGIIIGYLIIINRKDLFIQVIYGILAAILFSIAIGAIFLTIFSDLEAYKKLFEGIVMLFAASVLTWMILWMRRQSQSIRSEIELKIDQTITSKQKAGIFLLVFSSVAREGAELVLFLYANFLDNLDTLDLISTLSALFIGSIAGLLVAIIFAFILFKTTTDLDIKKFFQITSIILIIFAAGLLVHGVHEIFEFLENTSSPLTEFFIWNETWNINDTFLGDIFKSLFGWSYVPEYPNRFEKSFVGSILVGLFGWNDNPSFIEVIAYLSYYVIIVTIIKAMDGIKKTSTESVSTN